MLQNQILVGAIGYDHKVLGGDKRQETLIRCTDKRFACSQDVEKLLRHTNSTHWPKSSTYSAGHYHAKGVFIHTLYKKDF